jgi:DNA polymerase
MAWSEPQRRMLEAMGLRLWAPPADEAEAPRPEPVAAAVPVKPAAAQRTRTPDADPAPARAPSATPSLQPVRGDLAALGWPELRATVAGCRGCGLCESRTQTVFGTGHLQAHWLVLGEAPGESEDLQGEPFVGASGQLLDRMLAALQLTRAEDGPLPAAQRVYIANTLKCRPPRNRNPSAQELAQCEPYLLRQIELLQPRIILAMGKFAAQALLRSDEPVGRLRGRVHRYQGVPLVVTYHPAYLLRSPQEKAGAWEDLCLAAGVASGSG